MKHKLQNQRGETIVEVIVSFMLLLMFTAMFVVSLRYARAMSQKAETLRETAYAFCAGLYPQEKQAPAWQTEKTGQSFTFSAGAGAGAVRRAMTCRRSTMSTNPLRRSRVRASSTVTPRARI